MELDELRIFQAVLQEGGVTRAALRLNRVQSNVTTRLKQLEEKLGVELFLRDGKRMIATDAASVLNDYAEKMLSLEEEARQALADSTPRGRLRLGAMESTAAVRLAPALAEYHRRFPGVQLELKTGVSADLSRAVLDGLLDAALVSGRVDDARLAQCQVYEEEIVLVAAAGLREATPAMLMDATLLTFGRGCAYRQRLEQWLQDQGLQARRVIELFSYHAMLGCVACGMGVALLPRSLLASMPQAAGQVSVHSLPASLRYAQTMLVHRSHRRLPALEAMRMLLLDKLDPA